jgi:hypothetical protein
VSDGFRDHLPTYPCDLSDYARIHTGPGSWSADSDDLRDVLTAPDALRTFLDDEPVASVVDGPFMDVRRSDVPRATEAAEYVAPVLDMRELRVLSLVDGVSSIAALLEDAELPEHEVLDVLADLWARGVVAFLSRDGSVRELDAE